MHIRFSRARMSVGGEGLVEARLEARLEEIEGSVVEKMDTSDCDLEGEESSCESNLKDEVRTCAGKDRRHTSAQLATLNAYYKFGMVGVGKHYSTLITAASGDCNLSEKQIKVVRVVGFNACA